MKRYLLLLPLLLLCAGSAHAAVVQVCPTTGTGGRFSTSPFDITCPGALTAGNAVVVFVQDNAGTTRTVSSVAITGCASTVFTASPSSPAKNSTISQAWMYTTPSVVGSGCTHIVATLSSSTGKGGALAIEYSGLATSSIVNCDAVSSGTVVSPGNGASGSCTSTVMNSTIVIGFSFDGDLSPYTAGTGYTIRVAGSTGGSDMNVIEDKSVTSSGLQSSTLGGGAGTATYESVLVVLKSATQPNVATQAGAFLVGP